ncbi:MAG: 5'/3'-nucleotidase SurE [Spirochaetia bacterium]|jgi:5'-nucleotidase|nr:5'/3'-nucleotidase SurE [Spirochaetales bacterium]MDX9783549.1 5'/3'-nucleotidase SurE [Spirochaetia bacterium]
MRILVTNDDGIDAEGLSVLVSYLSDEAYGGKDREIIVLAPEGERSGVSHAMTLRHPTKVRKLKEAYYSCSGTPADCVIVAGLGILPWMPDLVVSGINRGPNMGTDIIYSGTCGAARQAALAGVPGIAVSCAQYKAPLDYRCSASFVARNLEALLSYWRKDCFININCPSADEAERPARWTLPGINRYHDALSCFDGLDGYRYCFLGEGKSERLPDPVSDHHAVAEGEIALSLIQIHPVASQPESWNGQRFLPGRIESSPGALDSFAGFSV